VTSITPAARASADTLYMETKTRTPILEAVLQQHREDDRRHGVDPYNTGRHRALLLHTVTPQRRKVAEDILVGFDTENWL
jgi:hypothetical protein